MTAAPDARASGLAAVEWALLAGIGFAFAPALGALARLWSEVDYLSHGFLVPVVALWVALRIRPRWERLPVLRNGWGALAFAAALILYGLGLLSGSLTVQALSLVVAVASGVWWSRGTAWLRALVFPLFFLAFLIPPPAAWISPLIVALQSWVSIAAVEVARALGVPVIRVGNVLELASGEALFVAEACSGVTSVVTLAPLGVLLAYLVLRTPWTRCLLVAAVVPLAMLGNGVRVVGTLMAAHHLGAAAATEGPGHTLLGLATYVVACLGLIGLGAALRRFESSPHAPGRVRA